MSIAIKDQGSLWEIKQRLAQCLAGVMQTQEEVLLTRLERASQLNHGHLSLPVFIFAKEKKQAPKDFAKELEQKINEQNFDFLEKAESLSGFVNFYFTPKYLQQKLEKLFQQKELACFNHKQKSTDPAQHLVIDFASPNVAKYMNVGHLRASAIGQALVNLAKQFQYKITSINHLGDWGSQFGKLLWAYKKWQQEYDFKNQAFETLVKLYTRFYKEAESDPVKLKEATDLFQKLEQGDPELKILWQKFVNLSLKNYEQYWKDLNIHHDLVQGESFYSPMIPDLKSRLQKQNLLQKSEGAEVVFLDEDTPPCLITKSDGASTYGARDLCSVIYRFETLKADQNIYVTGSDQKLHFKQIFKTLEKMQKDWSVKSHHVCFGMYRFKGAGKMSSRQGQAIYLKDLLEQTTSRVFKIIEDRRPELKNKEQIAKQVGVGALIFNDLMNDSAKDVDFDWDKVLDFESRSGPFVQYTLVRCFSLLKKASQDAASQTQTSQGDALVSQTQDENFSLSSLEDSELKLAWLLLSFEDAVVKSFTHFKVHILARYLLDLCKEFSRFYASERILDSERSKERLLLVQAVKKVLIKGLNILNVPQPEQM